MGLSNQPNNRTIVSVLLILFIFGFTGFNYLRSTGDTTDGFDGYVEISDFGFSFITPEEVDIYHIGITQETISEDSGWFIAKLDGDTKQYGVIWTRQDQIPSNYTRDLSGFRSFVLETVEEDGIVFSDEGETTVSMIDKHEINEQLFWILEGDMDTPVLTGWWCCDETGLYIMVYSLLSPDSGSMEELAETWSFYAQNVKCCEGS